MAFTRRQGRAREDVAKEMPGPSENNEGDTGEKFTTASIRLTFSAMCIRPHSRFFDRNTQKRAGPFWQEEQGRFQRSEVSPVLRAL